MRAYFERGNDFVITDEGDYAKRARLKKRGFLKAYTTAMSNAFYQHVRHASTGSYLKRCIGYDLRHCSLVAQEEDFSRE